MFTLNKLAFAPKDKNCCVDGGQSFSDIVSQFKIAMNGSSNPPRSQNRESVEN